MKRTLWLLALTLACTGCDDGDGSGSTPGGDMMTADQSVADPDMAVPDPDMAVPMPDMAAAMLDMAVADPDMAVADPDMAVADPDMAVADPDMAMLDPDMGPSPITTGQYLMLNFTDTVYALSTRRTDEPAVEQFMNNVPPDRYIEGVYDVVTGRHTLVLRTPGDGVEVAAFDSPFQPNPATPTLISILPTPDGPMIHESRRNLTVPDRPDNSFFVVYNLTATPKVLDTIRGPVPSSIERPQDRPTVWRNPQAAGFSAGFDLSGTGTIDSRFQRDLVHGELDEFFLVGSHDDGYRIAFKAPLGEQMPSVDLPLSYPDEVVAALHVRNLTEEPLSLWLGWPELPLERLGPAAIAPRTRVDLTPSMPLIDFPIHILPPNADGTRDEIIGQLDVLRALDDPEAIKVLRINPTPDGAFTALDNTFRSQHGEDRDYFAVYNIGAEPIGVSQALNAPFEGDWTDHGRRNPRTRGSLAVIALRGDHTTFGVDVDLDGVRDFVAEVPQAPGYNEAFIIASPQGGEVLYLAAPGEALGSAPLVPAPM